MKFFVLFFFSRALGIEVCKLIGINRLSYRLLLILLIDLLNRSMLFEILISRYRDEVGF